MLNQSAILGSPNVVALDFPKILMNPGYLNVLWLMMMISSALLLGIDFPEVSVM